MDSDFSVSYSTFSEENEVLSDSSLISCDYDSEVYEDFRDLLICPIHNCQELEYYSFTHSCFCCVSCLRSFRDSNQEMELETFCNKILKKTLGKWIEDENSPKKVSYIKGKLVERITREHKIITKINKKIEKYNDKVNALLGKNRRKDENEEYTSSDDVEPISDIMKHEKKRKKKLVIKKDVKTCLTYLDLLKKTYSSNEQMEDKVISMIYTLKRHFKHEVEEAEEQYEDNYRELVALKRQKHETERDIRMCRCILKMINKVHYSKEFMLSFCEQGFKMRLFTDYLPETEIMSVNDGEQLDIYFQEKEPLFTFISKGKYSRNTFSQTDFSSKYQKRKDNKTYSVKKTPTLDNADIKINIYQPLKINPLGGSLTQSRYVNAKMISFKLFDRDAKIFFVFGASNKEAYCLDFSKSSGDIISSSNHQFKFLTSLNKKYCNIDFSYYDNTIYFFTDKGLYSYKTSDLRSDNYFYSITTCVPKLVQNIKDFSHGAKSKEKERYTTGECVRLFTDGCDTTYKGSRGFLFVDERMRAVFFSFSNKELTLLGREGDIVNNIINVVKPFNNSANPLISMYRRGSNKCLIYDITNERTIFETDKDKLTTLITLFNKNPHYKNSLFAYDDMLWFREESFRPPFLLDGYQSIVRVYSDIYLVYLTEKKGCPYYWYYVKIAFEKTKDVYTV